jgi:hypothetical protein
MKMRKLNFYLLLAVACVLCFTSCKKDDNNKEQTIDFESVTLNSSGYQNNFPDSLKLNDVTFYNSYDATYSDWEGFAVSNNTDQTTAGYTNQYSVYSNSGANNSQKFAVAYQGFNKVTNCHFAAGETHTVSDLMINNATYTALSLKNGDGYGKKFVAGDWFKIIITGYNANGVSTGAVEYYLGDFRNGGSYICSTWTKVDLSSLGKVNKLTFTFQSTDNDPIYGMKTPAYACIDNINYYIDK